MNTCVSRIFKEQCQNDLELHLLCGAFTAAFSNQCGQSSSFEPASKHYADSSANKPVTQVSVTEQSFGKGSYTFESGIEIYISMCQ